MNAMMKREIEAQGELLAQVQPQLAARADEMTPPAGRVFVGGCGDSAFAPRALCGVFEVLGQPFQPRTSMELASFTRFKAGDCVVLSSISGGTKRTVEAAEVARSAGARTIAVTCNADSALAKVAEQYLKKGSKVYVEGQLQTRKWTDQSGVEKYTTEVVLQRFRGELTLLDKAERAAPDPDDYGSTRTREPAGQRQPVDSRSHLDDDIPF